MEPEMEDKTLELMVRRVASWHRYHSLRPVSRIYRRSDEGFSRRQERAGAAC